MARKRMVSPEFFTSEQILRVSPLARLLFVGLWCQADRRGILEDRPVHLKINVLPMDACDLVALLDELASSHGHDGAPLVYRYQDNTTGRPLIWIPGFCRHQHPHKDEKTGPYALPAPGEPWASTLLAQCQHGASTMAARCQPGAKAVAPPVQHHGSRPDSGFRMPNAGVGVEDEDEGREKALMSPSAPLACPEPLKEPPEAVREEAPAKPSGPSDWMTEIANHWIQVAKVNRYAGAAHIRLTDKRRKAMGARHEDWKTDAHIALDRMLEDPDPFWSGGGSTGWVADFDWFIRPDTVAKILERRPPLRGMESLGWRPGKGWRSNDPNDYTGDQWRRIVTEWTQGEPWPPGRPEDWPARISQIWKDEARASDEAIEQAERKARNEAKQQQAGEVRT